jgi:hypothetical protein
MATPANKTNEQISEQTHRNITPPNVKRPDKHIPAIPFMAIPQHTQVQPQPGRL